MSLFFQSRSGNRARTRSDCMSAPELGLPSFSSLRSRIEVVSTSEALLPCLLLKLRLSDGSSTVIEVSSTAFATLRLAVADALRESLSAEAALFRA